MQIFMVMVFIELKYSIGYIRERITHHFLWKTVRVNCYMNTAVIFVQLMEGM